MTLQQRFDAKYIPEPNSGCWLWIGAVHRQGYGQIAVATKDIRLAHRVSWFLHRGEMPPAHIKVCHACDNPACVNPDHLWLGSQRDNTADCINKGRARRSKQRGSSNGRAVLTEAQVRLILRDRRLYREIAHEYEVSESAIGMIKRGHNWPHLFNEWQSHEATKRTEARL